MVNSYVIINVTFIIIQKMSEKMLHPVLLLSCHEASSRGWFACSVSLQGTRCLHHRLFSHPENFGLPTTPLCTLMWFQASHTFLSICCSFSLLLTWQYNPLSRLPVTIKWKENSEQIQTHFLLCFSVVLIRALLLKIFIEL